MKKTGTVYLVGAGPGDPGLITVRGAELLGQADVIVYDHLVNKELLRYAKKEAKIIYVGKTFKAHSKTQTQINKLLIQQAKKSKKVVRLKGGDPFIFGRGGEEAEVLKKAHISFEVVPGITSAIAGPAYAGIPVTHRDFNSMVSLITGHEDPNKENSHIDWPKLAHNNATLVFLMGVGQLPQITRKLILHGMEPSTPVAVISWATWSHQKTVTGTLEDIGSVVKQNKVRPPAVIVVGKVVSLRDKIAWFENRPLFGRRIVVTRARAQASDLSRTLREKGAEVIELPTIKIQPIKNAKPLDQEIRRLNLYDWLIFTSVNGVEHFFNRLHACRQDVRALANVKLCAIGPATKEALEQRGLRVDVMPKEFVAEAIVKKLKKSTQLKGKKILVPRAKEARDLLIKELQKSGAQVKEVAVYETIIDRENKDGLLKSFREAAPDIVTFTSSSTAKNFVDLVGKKSFKTIFSKSKFVSIGPITSKTAKGLGIKIAAQAKQYTIPGLLQAIEKLS